MTTSVAKQAAGRQGIVVPLALCQFVASYACTNMNVAISDIAKDLGTTVRGVQTAITLFTLVMAALMIPGSKLTDIWGRRRCFVLGLFVYGAGAVLAAVAQGLPLLIIGYSLFEGVGSALMIPPIYILLTVAFSDTTARAKAFGAVSAAAGIGAAAGPLIGGVITTGISWRASFAAQALMVAVIVVLARRIDEGAATEPRPHFDLGGAVLSGVGMLLVVVGFLASGTYGWFVARKDVAVGSTTIISKGGVSPTCLFITAGLVVLAWCYVYLRARERHGKEPLLATSLFHNRTSNLGLVTQNSQWLMMQGSFFVISVFLQEVRGYSAIETGVVLIPATIGILGSSAIAGRLAQRYTQKTLIWSGFLVTLAGIGLLLLLARATSNIFTFVPGLLLTGTGVGVMLTSSVNVVQSAFPESAQGEISGLSRSVSNLGTSLGTAIVGSVLVSTVIAGNARFFAALVTMAGFGIVGLLAALRLPRQAAGTASIGSIASRPGASRS